MAKDVHIIAKGKGWEEAPPDGNTWGVNDIILRRDQLKLLFHMHNLPWIIETDWRDEAAATKLIKQKAEQMNIPVMTLEAYNDWKTAVRYPLDEIIEKFKTTYFGSSLDLMLAYALYEGYEDIHLYGVNLVIKKEYIEQRPSLEYWIGFGRGLGRKITIHNTGEDMLLKTFDEQIYGYFVPQFKVE